MGLWVKEGGESESPVLGRTGQVPSCNGGDRGYATHMATSPHAKAGANVPFDDFHLVSRHEKADGDTETGVRRKGSSQVAAGASLRKSPETAAWVSSSA
jgi:hypothetical protein